MNRTYREILDAVAADRIPSDLNLLPRIANPIPHSTRGSRQAFGPTLRSRPALLILLLLVALAFLTGVTYVIGKSMGYLPGAGLVDLSASVRVLKEPVRVQQGGIIIVLDQVIADTTRTLIQYHFDGYPFGPGDFFPLPILRLINGKELNSTGGGGMGWGSESGRINTSNTFPPIPADTQKAVLVFYKVDPTEQFGPTFNLEVPFSLIPAPKNFVTPGIEIGVTAQESGLFIKTIASPIPEKSNETPAIEQSTPTLVPNGSGLYLDRIIEYEDFYLLVGNFTDAGDLPGPLFKLGTSEYSYPITFTDAKGVSITAWPRTDIRPAKEWESSFYWAYEVDKPIHFPLTLRLESVDVLTVESDTIQFDTGVNPQVGQTWNINQQTTLRGVDYVIKEVTMTNTGYSFTITHPASANPIDLEVHILGGDDDEGWSNNDISYPDKQIANVNYKSGHIPTGKLTVELSSDGVVSVPGPWTLVWSPPVRLK